MSVDLNPNRVSAGKSGGGRYDFKRNSEAEIDLFDFDNEDPIIMEAVVTAPRVGEGNISESRSYLRAINAIDNAKTTEEMGAALADLLRNRGEVSGFDTPQLNVERTREVSKTLADLFTKYPMVTANIRIQPIKNNNTNAQAVRYRRRGEQKYFKKEIHIASQKLKTSSKLGYHFDKAKEAGHHHVVNNDVTPMQYVVTHEFGHLMDYTPDKEISPYKVRTAHAVEQGFANGYIGEAHSYFLKNTSLYGNTSRGELIAEAFADVEMNGDEAFEYSKALHAELIGAVHASV